MHHVYADASCVASFRYLFDAKEQARYLRLFHPSAKVFILPA